MRNLLNQKKGADVAARSHMWYLISMRCHFFLMVRPMETELPSVTSLVSLSSVCSV